MQSKTRVRFGDRQQVHDEDVDARADLLAEPGAATVPDLHDHQRPEAPRDANQTRQIAQEPQGEASTLRAADCEGGMLLRQPGAGTSANSWRNWLIGSGFLAEFPPNLNNGSTPNSAPEQGRRRPGARWLQLARHGRCRSLACTAKSLAARSGSPDKIAPSAPSLNSSAASGSAPPAFEKGLPIVLLSFGGARGERKARRLATAGSLVWLLLKPTPAARLPCNRYGHQRRHHLSERPWTNRRRTVCNRSGRSRHGRWPCR
jgi:hypothetical protein